jgi:hypothetical protein
MQSQQLPVFLFALFPLVFLALWCFVCVLLSFVGSWRRLALSYATDQPPRGTPFRWQSGTIGFVQYRNCLNFDVAEEGLYLSAVWLFRLGHRTLLIPWSAINDVQEQTIFWYAFTRFRVGTPSIATMRIPTKIFEACRTAN